MGPTAERFRVNVLWVSPYSIFGGPHNAIVQIAEPLRARGWESLVLLPDDPGNAAERLESGGVETVPLSLHHLQATLDPRVHLGMAAASAERWPQSRSCSPSDNAT